jgi:hypothetical protein
MCLVWFQTKKPANQNHGFLKPNQTNSMVWSWFWFEGCKTKKPWFQGCEIISIPPVSPWANSD